MSSLSGNCRGGIAGKMGLFCPSITMYLQEYTSFYNRAEQGRVAVDYVIVMGYDEHHAGGDAGSVASLPYVKKGIADTAAVVPERKVVNAIPFYTRVWTLDGDEDHIFSAREFLLPKNG